MRSEKEKKSITKSIKLSPLQVQQIEEKAKEKNLTFSSYMVDCAVHGNNSITPQMAVRMQELVNMVLEIADSIDSSEYIRKAEYLPLSPNHKVHLPARPYCRPVPPVPAYPYCPEQNIPLH